MAALGLTIPSANGGNALVFTVKGQSLGNQTTAFSNALANASSITFNTMVSAGSAAAGGSSVTLPEVGTGAPVTLNEIFSTNSSVGPFTIGAGGEYTAALVGTATTINGSAAGGDTVVATSLTTYNAVGSNNNVAFLYGENTYNGSTVAGAGGDTVTGGEGYDTVNTGTGNTTVFGGFGSTLINLNDSTAGAAFNDVVYLGDGHGVVNANGVNDVIVTGVSGQTIHGGGDTVPNASSLAVVIASKTQNPGFNGSDLITAGAARTSVFDSVGGNTIFGGTGQLDFIGEQRPGLIVADTIFAGTGSTAIFATADNDLTIGNAAGTPVLTIIAGLGNETLNGANAAGGADFILSNTTGDTTGAAGKSPINDTVVGGNFYNYFQTGSGNEAITGGTGENIFGLGLGGAGTHVTIFDFAQGTDFVNFLGQSQDQVAAAENMATLDANGNLQLTLSDTSTVTFVGLNNVSQLTGHVIS